MENYQENVDVKREIFEAIKIQFKFESKKEGKESI